MYSFIFLLQKMWNSSEGIKKSSTENTEGHRFTKKARPNYKDVKKA